MGHERSIYERFTILGYEFGKVQQSVVYANSHTDPVKQRALLANALMEAADMRQQYSMMVAQLQEMAERLGVSSVPSEADLEADGLERFYDRMDEFEKWREEGNG